MIKTDFPLISVCIPVFNGENHIKECVESVLNQAEKNFELLVVDNCSTDQTVNIVREYDDLRLKLFVNKSNLGLVNNFNRCIELAKGDFVVLLPHDDTLLPTALETYSRALILDPNVGLVFSAYYIINESGQRLKCVSDDAKSKIMNGKEAFIRLAKGNPIQCAMVRREIYPRLGLWDPNLKLICDWDMWCRIALAGYKFAYFKDPQNCYRIHSKNEHKSFISDNMYNSDIFKGMKKVFDAIPSQSGFQKLRPLSAKAWILGGLIKHLISSLLLGNWRVAKQDINLFIELVKWVGFFRMTLVLLSMPLGLIKRFKRGLSNAIHWEF